MPILLAAFAVLEGVAGAERIYGIVFVVVAFSVVVQGGELARRRGSPRRPDAHRRQMIGLALALLAAGSPALHDLHVSNGSRPFAGDGRLLTTVSPNGDGVRDRAIVRFRLDRPAIVRLDVLRTDTLHPGRATKTIWSTTRHLRAGQRQIVWRPSRGTEPRTYVLRLRVGHHEYMNLPGKRRRAPVVRVQGIEAGFLKRSYAPGEEADLRISSDTASLRLQVFYYSSQVSPRGRDFRTAGTAMTNPVQIDWRRPPRRTGSAPVRSRRRLALRALFRAAESSGRPRRVRPVRRPAVAPHVHASRSSSRRTRGRPTTSGTRDGDGWGDSWYVSPATRSVDLTRPFLDFGVPYRFRDWDLDFIAWLNRTGKPVDFLSDDDLAAFTNGDELAAAYDLVVFPGHAEYVTEHAYDVVQRFRDRGGNLMFLAANNFFWKVRRDGQSMTRAALWRKLGRPEAALVGVQYAASDYGGAAGGLRRPVRRDLALGVGRDRARERRPLRHVRDRDRRARSLIPVRHSASRVDPRSHGRGTLGGDDLLRDPLGREGLRRGHAQLHGLHRPAGRLATRRERLVAPQPAVRDRTSSSSAA